jgi:predicted secreted protein
MAKRIALKDLIEVDGHDLSTFCRAVEFSSEHEEVDVSGFNSTGANERLAGQTVQSVTCEFFGSYGAGEVHDVLYDIHRDRSIVTFVWSPDQTAAVSATNPQLTGNVQVLTYSPGATRGEAEAFSVTLSAADSTGLVFSNT